MNSAALEADGFRFANLAVQFDQAKRIDEAVFYYKVYYVCLILVLHFKE